jgi:3-dehydrotetronate 4-kinase
LTDLLIGAIADDLTGAVDLAASLSRSGLRVAVSVGPPTTPPGNTDVLIVALKIRSTGIGEAVARAVEAARFLQRHGAARLYFKYSSTFDSGDTGNIGPVSDALFELCERAGDGVAVVCPAFPRLGRTVYQGHLFVDDQLLDRAGLGDHPLTPRRESSVVSLMSRQTAHGVGLVPLQLVRQGAAAVTEAFLECQEQGFRYVVTDATDDADLIGIATVCADHGLVTGSAGLAGALATVLRPARRSAVSAGWQPPGDGPCVILSGSVSEVTRRQIKAFARHGPVLRLDPRRPSDQTVANAVAWASARLAHTTALICSIRPDDERAASTPGREKEIESIFGRIATELYETGHRRFVVAGGETSGAVVQALGAGLLELGPEISPGVAWMADRGERGLLLALKSGNFGDEEFFFRAATSADRGLPDFPDPLGIGDDKAAGPPAHSRTC